MNVAKYPVERMCYVLGISKSAYYEWLKKKPLINKSNSLQEEVKKEFLASKKTYGSPRICIALNQRGICVSKSTVARVMKSLNLQARPRRKFVNTTNSKHNYMIFENILDRNFKSEKVNQKWVSDITYIPTKRGWVYLTIVMDLADKMVVGWNLSNDMTAHNTSVASLKVALKRRKLKDKLIFHSDRGIQYCSLDFRSLIKQNKRIIQSMSRKGNCWDNAPSESFFKTLKTEWTSKFNYENIHQAKHSIFDYIERWYNTKRKHSAIGYMSPLQKHYFLTQTAA